MYELLAAPAEKFFDPSEVITGSVDFSHSGGRLVKYSNDNFRFFENKVSCS